MDNVTIKAKVASSVLAHGVSIVGFADDEKNPAAYLTLQRQVGRTKGLDQEQYYLELCGQPYGAYGGVLKCEISHPSLF